MISYLPSRAPNLEAFRLCAVRSTDTPPEPGLDMVIGSLPRLKKVLVSSSLLTPSLFHFYATLNLHVEYVASIDPGLLVKSGEDFSRCLRSHSFSFCYLISSIPTTFLDILPKFSLFAIVQTDGIGYSMDSRSCAFLCILACARYMQLNERGSAETRPRPLGRFPQQ